MWSTLLFDLRHPAGCQNQLGVCKANLSLDWWNIRAPPSHLETWGSSERSTVLLNTDTRGDPWWIPGPGRCLGSGGCGPRCVWWGVWQCLVRGLVRGQAVPSVSGSQPAVTAPWEFQSSVHVLDLQASLTIWNLLCLGSSYINEPYYYYYY